MIKKGQIVEIPITSPLYSERNFAATDRTEALSAIAFPKAYSLFDGFLVGDHDGLRSFSMGQRKGIGVGGKKAPLYVIGKDETENRLFVGEGENHPGLWASVFSYSRSQITSDSEYNLPDHQDIDVTVGFSENNTTASAVLYATSERIYIEFKEKLSITLYSETLQIIINDRLSLTIFST